MKKILNKFTSIKNKYPKSTYFFCFTVLFILVSLAVFFHFRYNDKSFIWTATSKDGLEQHYNALMYWGKYLRSIAKSLLIDHQLSIPLWDFSMGYGSDILTTLHYYVAGDPLNLLAVFVSPKNTEYLYEFLIYLRVYLAGLTFSYYCFYMKKSNRSILMGALTYMFCGYALFSCMRHPYFTNPMIYLPLLCLGVERIFAKKSPVLFILMIALSAISNFYFLYMLCILVFIYAVVRYFTIFKQEDHFKVLPKLLLKCLVYFLIGIAISAIFLLPVIYLFFNASRSQDKVAFDMIYSLTYYQKFFLNFTSYSFVDYYLFTGFSCISLISVFVLFITSKNKWLKVFFVVLTLCVCIPFFGYMFNGFSYLSNRWSFGYSFLIALVVTFTYEDLLMLSKKKILYLGMFILAYISMIVLFKDVQNLNAYLSLIFVVLTFIVIILNRFLKVSKRSTVFITPLLLSFVVAGISINAFFKYSPMFFGYVNEFADLDKGYSSITNSRAKTVKNIKDDGFFRYDETVGGKNYLVNGALQQKQNSISFFYSLGSGDVTNFLTEMDSLNALSSYYRGIDERCYLQTLASVKYFVANNNQSEYVPYGFDEVVVNNSKYSVYKTNMSLPIGYTYDKQIDIDTYNSLSSVQKQQALLQGVVVDQNLSLDEPALVFSDDDYNYEILSSSNLVKTSDGFEVKKEDAKVKLSFNGQKNTELYAFFDNLIFKTYKDNDNVQVTSAYVTLEVGGVSKTINLKNEYNNYYNGTKDFLVQLGYNVEPRSEIEITFHTPGKYICDNLNITGLNMKNFDQQVSKLKENILEDVVIETNKVTGNISLDKDKFLCLSIPYSTGWSVLVDGKEETLLKANTMYMGVNLKKGNHTIELVYTTPLLMIGAIATSIGVLMLGGIVFIRKSNKNKE